MNFSAVMREPSAFCAHITGKTNNNKRTVLQFMRISLLITVITFMSVQLLLALPAKGQNMYTDQVKVNLKYQSLEEAIRQIEQQTSFIFFYRKSSLTNLQILNLPYASRTVEQTLTELLKNTFLTFRQADNHIFLEKSREDTAYKVSGRVLSIEHKPVEMATITLKNASNLKDVQIISADTTGNFKLTVAEKGNYLLVISAVGMDSLIVGLELSDLKLIRLPDITLHPFSHRLKEVSVVGQKPLIEQKIDRTILNVNSLITNSGASALEVLEKSPGVLVDANGNISFKGKSGVLVLINDKPTYLSGNNLIAYLKSLPASTLDQIELMDNPPAKYDAAGDAGVINIKTRKSKAAGFNGSVSANYGQAHYGQTNESLDLNYRTGKFNFFANASYGINRGFRRLDLNRNYFDAGGSAISAFNQTQFIKSKTVYSNLKLGADFFLSQKTTWGVVFLGSLSPGWVSNPSTNLIYNGNAGLDSVVTADNHIKSHFNNGGINFNYSHQFDKTGKAISFDLDYLSYSASRDEQFFNQTRKPDNTLTTTQALTDYSPTAIQIYSAKTDFTQPIGADARIDAGLKTSYVSTDNKANYFNLSNGVSTVNYNFSNQFLYNENINAGYLNFNKVFKRFEIQVGLRMENTNASGHQLGNLQHADSSFTRHYTDIFPTAYISYKLDTSGNHLLVASFGRRIGRPYYQDLNPFVQPSDKFTYSSGNPFLRPQYTTNYKLAYSYKSIFTIGLYYNHVSDYRAEVIRQEGNIFIDGTGNIGSASFLGIAANLSLKPKPWWFLNLYAHFFRNEFKGQLFNTYLDQSSTYPEFNLTNQFTFTHDWSAEISGFYVGNHAEGQAILYVKGQLNAGLQKKILRKNLSVRFSVRDLLKTYTSDGINTNILNATSTFRNRFNSQSFMLGLTYNFGTAVNKRKRETGSAETEQSRVKN